MLGKLFKYEFKNTAKLMLTIYGIFIITTIIASFSFSSDAMQNDIDAYPPIIQLLIFAAIMLYFLSIFALFIVTYVYVCIHFYKTMYSDQGYLTHTLPVKPMTLFNVKLTTSWVWMMGSMGLLFLSIFSIMTGATRGEIIWANRHIQWEVAQSQFESMFGMSIGGFTLLMIVLMAFSCVSYLLMVYASISIGQLFNQHKIVWAIVAGIVIYFIEQTVGSIILLLTGGSFFNTYVYADALTFYDLLVSPPMIASMVASVLFTIAFYVICVVIQKKHINLD